MKYCLRDSLIACISLSLLAPAAVGIETLSFQSGQPAWVKDRAEEMNLSLGFRAVVEVNDSAEKVVLRVAASTIYRAWINGELVAHGPARCAHGFYRVDVIDVSSQLKAGSNVVAIEVAGYNSNSYYVLDQPSFLQAELIQGVQVLASTLGEGEPFQAGAIDYRVQKVQRYSFQRPFIEVYQIGRASWRERVVERV